MIIKQSIGGDLYQCEIIKQIGRLQILKETFKVLDKKCVRYKLKLK